MEVGGCVLDAPQDRNLEVRELAEGKRREVTVDQRYARIGAADGGGRAIGLRNDEIMHRVVGRVQFRNEHRLKTRAFGYEKRAVLAAD